MWREKGKEFMIEYYERFPKDHRFVKIFLENLDGQSIFISKFIRSQEPPE